MTKHTLFFWWTTSLLVACNSGTSDKTGTSATDGAETTDGTTDDGTPDPLDGLRPLATPSGACPDLSSSGYVTFTSNGQERNASVIVPAGASGPMPLVFFFHGLMDPGSTPEPTEYMADALNMQTLADEFGAVIVLPEAPIMDLYGFRFFLWDIALESDDDLVLFDDLRACAADQLDVDLARTTAWGFSGGALWTTVMVSERGDAFAAVVEASGGSDIVVPIWPDPAAAYATSAYTMPALLMSGGESDVWPDASLTLVDFEEATTRLEGQMVGDDHTVVRCHHSAGHTITNKGFLLSLDWVMEHRFGEASPWADGDLGTDADWCTLAHAQSGR